MDTISSVGTVVVGVDGSDVSRQAIDWAADQAALESRQLLLVHVTETHPVNSGDRAQRPAAWTAALLEEATDQARTRAPGIEIGSHLARGVAHEVLTDLGDHATMLVLGSRGRGPIASTLLGSVGVAVAMRASCPVVVVRPHHRGAVRRGVLVGVDTAPDSRPVLEFGYRQASLHDLPLTVLHCVRDGDSEKHRLHLAELIAGMTEKFPDVHVTRRLIQSPVEDGILTEAASRDLVVVGRPEPGRRDSHVGTTLAGSVIEHGGCVVAIVPTSH